MKKVVLMLLLYFSCHFIIVAGNIGDIQEIVEIII